MFTRIELFGLMIAVLLVLGLAPGALFGGVYAGRSGGAQDGPATTAPPEPLRAPSDAEGTESHLSAVSAPSAASGRPLKAHAQPSNLHYHGTALATAGQDVLNAELPVLFPRDCDDVTPPGQDLPSCCIYGYVYQESAPTDGANLNRRHPEQVSTFPCRIEPQNPAGWCPSPLDFQEVA